MDYYIYYRKDPEPDVAVVEAPSLEEAIEQLKKYFSPVAEDEVMKIDCHRDGYADGIMIVSSY